MKLKLLQMILVGTGVLASVSISAPAVWNARLILPDGSSRLVELEGVGCTQSICSRTHISGKAEHGASAAIAFDGIAVIQNDPIRNTTSDTALFVLKDGTRQQMSLVADFRVLYFLDESGRPQKLDLAAVKSLEFLPQR